MVWIVIILGYLAMAICVIILIAPEYLRRILEFFSIGNRVYLSGLIRIVLGIMLFFLASQARLWGYVVLVGLVAAGAGLSIFFFALKRTKELLKRMQKQSNLLLRIYAIIGLALWGLLIFALTPSP